MPFAPLDLLGWWGQGIEATAAEGRGLCKRFATSRAAN
ncbi:hypothetical protein CGMCC3_g18139 [Colletotrichum fructicola]|nr:uncharacterized protein CGMCC3_g18139 [Colletotrichum fructicola]KAE9565676.1 hypothetical protein CGMCC3_g18139 [Colletotrichum fructicola]